MGKVSGVITLIIIVVIAFVGFSYLNSLISKTSERSAPTYTPRPTYTSSPSDKKSTPSNTPSDKKSTTPQVPSPVIVSSSLNKGFGKATVRYSVRNNGADGWVTASVDLEVQYEDQYGLTRSYVKTRSDNFYIGSGETLDRSVEFSLSSGEKAIGYGIDFNL